MDSGIHHVVPQNLIDSSIDTDGSVAGAHSFSPKLQHPAVKIIRLGNIIYMKILILLQVEMYMSIRSI